MKMLDIYGDDEYAALEFEREFNGHAVKDIIEMLELDSDAYEDIFDEHGIKYQILEFGEIDPDFIKYVRKDIQDYDESKHSNFYFENEVIKF